LQNSPKEGNQSQSQFQKRGRWEGNRPRTHSKIGKQWKKDGSSGRTVFSTHRFRAVIKRGEIPLLRGKRKNWGGKLARGEAQETTEEEGPKGLQEKEQEAQPKTETTLNSGGGKTG